LTVAQVEALARERATLVGEAQRLAAIRELQIRQQAAAQANLHGPNIPQYRAPQEAPANNGPGPAAPGLPDGADPAGSPLPPEAFL
jgi:hypothetical protein